MPPSISRVESPERGSAAQKTGRTASGRTRGGHY